MGIACIPQPCGERVWSFPPGTLWVTVLELRDLEQGPDARLPWGREHRDSTLAQLVAQDSQCLCEPLGHLKYQADVTVSFQRGRVSHVTVMDEPQKGL